MNAENLKTLQRLTSILESKIDVYIREMTGVSSKDAGISANTIAREYTSNETLKILNAAHDTPSVKAISERITQATLNDDSVLATALMSDKVRAVEAEISKGLKSLGDRISDPSPMRIAEIKTRVREEISNYRARLWKTRARTLLRISAAGACVLFGGYNIFKSFD
jgi:hypothetical protein